MIKCVFEPRYCFYHHTKDGGIRVLATIWYEADSGLVEESHCLSDIEYLMYMDGIKVADLDGLPIKKALAIYRKYIKKGGYK